MARAVQTQHLKKGEHLSQNKGFTLVEILVVLGIIGVLASLLMANFVGLRERATDTSKKSNVDQLKKALRLYYNDNQNYPPDGSNNSIAGCGGGQTRSTCVGEFASGGTIYMKDLPQDFAYASNGEDTFLLVTKLGNLSDESIEASQTRCNSEIDEYLAAITVEEDDYVACQD